MTVTRFVFAREDYRGERTPDGCRVTTHGRPLPPRNDLVNHSPDGFEWGYWGSGPAQLALAVLANCCGIRLALPHEGWVLRRVLVHQWCELAEGDKPTRVAAEQLLRACRG